VRSRVCRRIVQTNVSLSHESVLLRRRLAVSWLSDIVKRKYIRLLRRLWPRACAFLSGRGMTATSPGVFEASWSF
jgi:hypothetical protein